MMKITIRHEDWPLNKSQNPLIIIPKYIVDVMDYDTWCSSYYFNSLEEAEQKKKELEESECKKR